MNFTAKSSKCALVFSAILLLLLTGTPLLAQDSESPAKASFYMLSGFWVTRPATRVLTLELPAANGSLVSFDTNLDAGQGGGFGFAIVVPFGTAGMAISTDYDMSIAKGDWSVSALDAAEETVSVQFLDGIVIGIDGSLGIKIPLGSRLMVTPAIGGSWRVMAGDVIFGGDEGTGGSVTESHFAFTAGGQLEVFLSSSFALMGKARLWNTKLADAGNIAAPRFTAWDFHAGIALYLGK